MKIRAALGEVVIVGEVDSRGTTNTLGTYIRVRISGSYTVDIWLNDGWRVEYIQELPKKIGAIIRYDGTLYVRHGDTDIGHVNYPWVALDDISEVWGDDSIVSGGFDIIFEGAE